MSRTSLAVAVALAICLSTPACSSPAQTDRLPSAAAGSGEDMMIVSGGGLRIGPDTSICVSGEVTLSSGLDSVGVNALDDTGLVGRLHGWADRALHRHGQARHAPANPSAPRVVRSEGCSPDGVALRVTLDPRSDGGPYKVRLVARQGTRVFTADVERPGLVRAQAGVPVLPGDRLPDGRPYWDVATDITRVLEAFEVSTAWIPDS